VRDADDIIDALRSVEARLRDLAYERLRSAAEDGDADAVADERKVLQARRAVARAISALDGEPDLGSE
jgi:hypothetical protein